jgi:hypothetical protein
MPSAVSAARQTAGVLAVAILAFADGASSFADRVAHNKVNSPFWRHRVRSI